ncbi:MAG: hypothetical protein AAGM40_22410, partial [Cyanobacteria bacterium J06573_2]
VLLLSPFASVPSVNANSISGQQKASGQSETTLLARGRGRASMSGASSAAGVGIDAANLGLEINKLVKTSRNREGFVRQALDVAYWAYKGRYNVVIFNNAQTKVDNFKGVKKVIPLDPYDGVYYTVYIFDRGTLINRGDGGYINWAFKGKFKRRGAKKVVFYSKKRPSKRRSTRRNSKPAYKLRSSISHSVNA